MCVCPMILFILGFRLHFAIRSRVKMHSSDPCIHKTQVGEREESGGGGKRQRAVRVVQKTR